jgi:hypothetical protein
MPMATALVSCQLKAMTKSSDLQITETKYEDQADARTPRHLEVPDDRDRQCRKTDICKDVET